DRPARSPASPSTPAFPYQRSSRSFGTLLFSLFAELLFRLTACGLPDAAAGPFDRVSRLTSRGWFVRRTPVAPVRIPAGPRVRHQTVDRAAAAAGSDGERPG